VRVEDESMAPTLRPGDRLRVDPAGYRTRLPARGDVVVLADPERADRWLVKRVRSVDPRGGTVEVVGDAADGSRDSRRFGPVPLASVIGRAYRIYLPADRRRDL
jgi:nickel-type superoxide dismutase maturation protease